MDCTSNVVALSRCPSYDREVLRKELGRLLGALDLPSLSATDRILLKPNLISVKHGTLACTEAAFMLAVAELLVEKGAKVSLGDSPAFGTAHHALGKLGLVEPLRRLGVEIVNFKKAVPVELASGVRLGMAREVLESDFLVNIPRVKAHGQLRMTMAVKNCFGCVVGMRKPWLHMAHGGVHGRFVDLLIELLDVLPPTLSLLDGVVAMHKTGPIRGSDFPLGVIGGSLNPVALDSTFYQMLGVDPRSVPLWWACLHAGKNGVDVGDLAFPLLRPTDIVVESYELPARLAPIRFRPLRFLRNGIKRLFLP